MEDITKVSKLGKQEPGLSSAYIRTLVKNLTSKDSLHSDDGLKKYVTQNNGECCSDAEKQKHIATTTQPQHKKQVRRRLHTSRPYQERLLNMAEARREIVTALKFHRASMKQQELASSQVYPSNNTAATATATATNSYSSLSCPPHPPYWPISTLAPPPPPSSYYHDNNQDFILPSRTLGLNLNYQNFDNLDPNLYHKPLSVYSTSSSSSSTSSTPSSSSPAAFCNYTPLNSSSGGLQHHAIMDDVEIKSLGEQHQTEWNDTINLVTSARWCGFLKTMGSEAKEGDETDVLHQFDQSMEFPPWLNDSSCMQHLDDHFSDDAYLKDSDLPCMDIGELEAMDGEWLA